MHWPPGSLNSSGLAICNLKFCILLKLDGSIRKKFWSVSVPTEEINIHFGGVMMDRQYHLRWSWDGSDLCHFEINGSEKKIVISDTLHPLDHANRMPLEKFRETLC